MLAAAAILASAAPALSALAPTAKLAVPIPGLDPDQPGLRAAFNEDHGKVRLLLILSPT